MAVRAVVVGDVGHRGGVSVVVVSRRRGQSSLWSVVVGGPLVVMGRRLSWTSVVGCGRSSPSVVAIGGQSSPSVVVVVGHGRDCNNDATGRGRLHGP